MKTKGVNKMDKQKAKEYINIDGKVNIETLTKAYKKAIFKHHPDHGGTSESFIELKNAYEFLIKDLKYSRKKIFKRFKTGRRYHGQLRPRIN